MKRYRKQLRRHKVRVSKKYTPDIIAQLRTMPTLPDGRINPLYSQYQAQSDSATDYRVRMQTQQLSEMRGENVDLKTTLNALKSETTELKKQNETLAKQKQREEEEKKLLQQKAKQNQTHEQLIDELGLSQLAREMNETEQSNQELQKNIAKAKSELMNNKKYQELKELKEKTQALNIEYDKLNGELTEAETIDAIKLQSAQSELDVLKRNVDLRKKKRDVDIELLTQKNLYEKMKEDTTTQIAELPNMIEEVKSMNEKYDKELSAFTSYRNFHTSPATKTFRNFSNWCVDKKLDIDPTFIKNVEDQIKYDSFVSGNKIDDKKFRSHLKTINVKPNVDLVKKTKLESDIKLISAVQNNIAESSELEKAVEEQERLVKSIKGKVESIKNRKDQVSQLAADYLELQINFSRL